MPNHYLFFMDLALKIFQFFEQKKICVPLLFSVVQLFCCKNTWNDVYANIRNVDRAPLFTTKILIEPRWLLSATVWVLETSQKTSEWNRRRRLFRFLSSGSPSIRKTFERKKNDNCSNGFEYSRWINRKKRVMSSAWFLKQKGGSISAKNVIGLNYCVRKRRVQ